MSRHEIVVTDRTWVFGWDNHLQSFFLQVHDHRLSEDDNPIVWKGADAASHMSSVDNLVRTARQYDLAIDPEMQLVLYVDQDQGR